MNPSKPLTEGELVVFQGTRECIIHYCLVRILNNLYPSNVDRNESIAEWFIVLYRAIAWKEFEHNEQLMRIASFYTRTE